MGIKEDNRNNIRLYKETKDERYKQKLIEDNRKLCLTIFNKNKEIYKQNSSISLSTLKEDLLQEGDLALSIAIDEFNPDKGIEFSTYAYTAIENSFYNYFRKNKSLMTYPKKTEILISKIRQAINQLSKNGSQPNSEEIASFIGEGITKEQVNSLIPLLGKNNTKVLNISDITSNDEEKLTDKYDNVFVSDYDTPFEAFEKVEEVELINKAIDTLSLKQKNIFLDYTKNKLTFRQISEKYSLTIEGARQVFLSAVKKINQFVKSAK